MYVLMKKMPLFITNDSIWTFFISKRFY